MKSLILAIAVALPQYNIEQSVLADRIVNMFSLTGKNAESLKNLYNKTQIKRRFSVLVDTVETDPNKCEFFDNDFFQDKISGTQKRNDIYKREAPKLAVQSARNVIEQWRGNPKELTHIISVSCTGVIAPGIEFILQNELNLSDTIKRIGINFMGCFGAFTALSVADALAKENPNNRILVVCTELCSLHYQVSSRPDILIGNALFADGSAAAIVGTQKREYENPIWSIEKTASYALKDSQDKMTWTASDNGFVMTLSKEIPTIIEQNILPVVTDFLGTKKIDDFEWAIHPGGKAIIEAIEKSCNIDRQKTKSSWDVLANYGNMSSATFLFVLKELEKNLHENKKVIGLGFGPGLSFETILLEKLNKIT